MSFLLNQNYNFDKKGITKSFLEMMINNNMIISEQEYLKVPLNS